MVSGEHDSYSLLGEYVEGLVAYRELQEWLSVRFSVSGGSQHSGDCLDVSGVHGALLPLLLWRLSRRERGLLQVVVAPDRERAQALYSDLSRLLPSGSSFYFPSSYHATGGVRGHVSESAIHRMDIIGDQGGLRSGGWAGRVIVTTPAGLAEGFIGGGVYEDRSYRLRVGDSLGIDELEAVLETLGFVQVEYVFNPGEYARRGSIVDLFSFSDAVPYRADFLGNSVDSIRSFDVESQLSTGRVGSLMVVPRLSSDTPSSLIRLGDLLPKEGTLLWYVEGDSGFASYEDALTNHPERLRAMMASVGESLEVDDLYQSRRALGAALSGFVGLYAGSPGWRVDGPDRVPGGSGSGVDFHSQPQPGFGKNIDLLLNFLNGEYSQGGVTFILCSQARQVGRLRDIFRENDLIDGVVHLLHLAVSAGFTLPQDHVNVLTDHQLFERYYVARFPGQMPVRDSQSVYEMTSLRPGDFVVHVDHGVGVYEGLVVDRDGARSQEFVRLSYRDGDTLLVSIHNLHRLSKYQGGEEGPPVLHRLGSGSWLKLKDRAKSKMQAMARELLALYAQRRASRGFQYSPDGYLQETLEASFMYEDTPDQLKATRDVKRDMERPVPMDRLICGDVGFGKTEVAVRAAFKAVTDGKQVAVLVPTTILALQHYKTFSARLEGFPCRVDYLSRLRTAQQRKAIQEDLAQGKVDILIGTHAILSGGVTFKDLGLLIIDEEQKFGVKAKERLKLLRREVDTLTLSATPIPRTLQFSLMGARDLSIIRTPPPNRYPIETRVLHFDRAELKRILEEELGRGGQVFFVHNRIDSLPLTERIIRELVASARVAVGHGQMPAQHLERVMIDFMEGEYDILLCTTIIESGLDIPNANTIIIDNGHMYGLSDLHQLRGRVGRSNRKAYCYILIPVSEALSPIAQRRLRAIVDFSDLGSGFSLSMQDLDIRGAGNLLGVEQSGFIANLGFETYQQILDEALMELRTGEFADLFAEELCEETAGSPKIRYANDCVVETDLDIVIPADFVTNPSDRIRLYREIDLLDNEESLRQLRSDLEDRFGELPERVERLFQIPPLRWQAMGLGIEKMTLKGGVLSLNFVSNSRSAFYDSPLFESVLRNTVALGSRAVLRQDTKQLRLRVRRVPDLMAAASVLDFLRSGSVEAARV